LEDFLLCRALVSAGFVAVYLTVLAIDKMFSLAERLQARIEIENCGPVTPVGSTQKYFESNHFKIVRGGRGQFERHIES